MSSWFFLFPGQGSQRVGMGGGFLDDPLVVRRFEEAEEILRFPLLRLVREGPEEELHLTLWAQPALFVLGYAVAEKLLERGVVPRGLLGHSLGEITALAVAGVFPFSTGVELTHLRGKAMQEAVPPEESAMVAVMGRDLESIKEILKDWDRVYIANWNHPEQIVLSGRKSDLDPLLPYLREKGVRKIIPLKVSAPFHTPYMEGAERALRSFLEGVAIAPPRYPVYSNLTAQPYPDDPRKIREWIALQVVHPVMWVEEIRNLPSDWQGIEFPPAGVLKGLIERISPSARVVPLRTPEDLRALGIES